MRVAAIAVALLLSGCGTLSRHETPAAVSPPPSPPASAPAPAKGAYYKDDGPGAHPPPDLASIPDAVPKVEPLHRFANRAYQVFGRDYTPVTSIGPLKETGIGSWYGRRYHGGATSNGEKYDMYAMSAAHPTLPIPSYARVTNLANGRSVVVRINDRGPFHSDRIIDLSYAAAWKLGYAEAGSARVEVEAVIPGETPRAQEGKGIFLQLGAFSAPDAAENFRVRVTRELAWLSDAIQVIAAGALYRLHLGPFSSQEQARSVADRIQSELGLRPVLVAR